MWSPLRNPDAPSAVCRTREAGEHPRRSRGVAQGERPAVIAGGRLERQDGAEAAVDQRQREPPFLEQGCHPVDRVALADAPESIRTPPCARTRKSSGSSSSDGSPVPIDTSKAPPVRTNTCRAITRHSMRRGTDLRALARREVVDPRRCRCWAGTGSARARARRRDRRRPARPAPRTAGRGARRTPRTPWPWPRARSAARRVTRAAPSIPSPRPVLVHGRQRPPGRTRRPPPCGPVVET